MESNNLQIAIEVISMNYDNASKQKAYSIIHSSAIKILNPFLRRRIDDDFIQEEVLSLSITKVLLKIHTYNHNQPFDAWVKTIGRNTLIDHLRTATETKIPISNIQSLSDSFEFIYETEDLKNYIIGLINKQSVRDKEVLHRRFILEQDCKFISKKLKLPHGTVLTILHRFRTRLKSSGRLAA